MAERWVDSKDSVSFSDRFWDRHRAALGSGKFWADEIKSLRGEPAKRLQLAFENLPLPAAFREAAIALRALIRDRRKRMVGYERELGLLYWLGAVASFGLPYSERLREPGYNVLESVPGETVANLRFEYSKLGYRELELLNKTDVKWMTELWGEPESHTTLNKLHSAVWVAAENRLMKRRQEERDRFHEDLRRILRS